MDRRTRRTAGVVVNLHDEVTCYVGQILWLSDLFADSLLLRVGMRAGNGWPGGYLASASYAIFAAMARLALVR